jgi:dUTP pyrophosphatase
MEAADAPHFLLCPSPEAAGLYADLALPGGACGDSGVDLRFPANLSLPPWTAQPGFTATIDFHVRARCRLGGQYVPFMVVPRSSIARTPLSLANSVGIIDRGYTGTLKVAVRNHSSLHVYVSKGESLFQLVRPDLAPATVEVVGADCAAFAADATLRGERGFGSTGTGGAGSGGGP